MEKSECSQKHVEKDSRNKEGQIAGLETQLRTAQHSQQALEQDNTQLKHRYGTYS